MTKLYCADCGVEVEPEDSSDIEGIFVCTDCGRYYDEDDE